MPQKPNKAGQMQNYVPAGNGDASGEYGDNATGSNKHFKAFGKENGTNLNNNTQQEKPTQEAPKKEKNTLSKLKDKTTSEKLKKHIEEIEKDLTPEGKEVINYLMEKYGDKFNELKESDDIDGSYFSSFDNKIFLADKHINRTWENKGQPLIHELTHFFTDKIKIGVDGKSFRWSQKEFPIGLAPIFEGGKSLTDIIKEEAQSLNRKKDIEILRKEKENAIDTALKKDGYSLEQYNEYQTNLKSSPDYQIRKDNIIDDYKSGSITRKEALKQISNIFDDIIGANRGSELAKACELYLKMDEINTKAKEQWYKDSGIATVSDMLSSNVYRGGTSGFGIGHSPDYFKFDKDYYGQNLNDSYSDEFTSNTLSAIATGNTKELETTKKYLPKSYEAFMYILNKYYKGGNNDE